MEAHPKIVKSISFGLKLNIDNCLDVLVKGPQANQEEAESFKLFWGNKSELRRFQDGYEKIDLFHLRQYNHMNIFDTVTSLKPVYGRIHQTISRRNG